MTFQSVIELGAVRYDSAIDQVCVDLLLVQQTSSTLPTVHLPHSQHPTQLPFMLGPNHSLAGTGLGLSLASELRRAADLLEGPWQLDLEQPLALGPASLKQDGQQQKPLPGQPTDGS
jgi:hypothetical protein